MNCPQAQRACSTAPHQPLTAEEQSALQQHLASCAACSQLSAEILNWRTEVANVRVPDAERAWQDLQRTIRTSETETRTTRRSASWTGWLSFSVTAAAAVAVGMWMREVPAPHSVPTARVAQISQSEDSVSTAVFVDAQTGWTVVWASDRVGPAHHAN